jgi:hypothetical protein
MKYLSEEQLRFFDRFGYLAFRQLFTPEETAWVTEEFETVIHTYGAGSVHDGSKRTFMVPTIDYSEKLCTLLDHPKIEAIACDILGDDFNYGSGDGNYYSGDTGWHPDGKYPELFAIKFAYYLDPVTRDTGCLRVIPGSHKLDSPWWLSDSHPGKAREQWGISPADVPGNIALETVPGDVGMFNHCLWHASFGGSTRRRMFTMNLIKKGHTPEEIAQVDGYLKHHCPVAHGFKIGGMYTDLMLDTASPGRRRHLAQCHERHALVHPDDTRPRPLVR